MANQDKDLLRYFEDLGDWDLEPNEGAFDPKRRERLLAFAKAYEALVLEHGVEMKSAMGRDLYAGEISRFKDGGHVPIKIVEMENGEFDLWVRSWVSWGFDDD